ALFQFESAGMKKYLKQLKPTVFEDLVAMNALYRPGPMAYIPSFINRKHGTEKIIYDHPLMESNLQSTYGITVYQEQVMLLSRKLANFTRSQSDNLRKAMGKKDVDTMSELKDNFIEGCLANEKFIEGCKQNNKEPEKIIEKIWHDWETFAHYAFNKSHSVCYAYVAYQTAYLKAHYPSHFMAAVLSSNLNDISKITTFMDEARRMGIEVFGPDINISVKKFTVDEDNNVRFGLAAIKGVGENVVEHFVQLREEEGPFKDIYDFAERVDFHIVNKKNIEALAAGGAFDSFGIPRSAYFSDNSENSFIDILTKYGTAVRNEKNNKQPTLFGDIKELEIPKPKLPDIPEWTKSHTLKLERDAIGMYLSAHPLDDYKLEIEHFTTCSLAELQNIENYVNSDVAIAGIVTSEQVKTTKNNEPYGRYEIEDYTGTYEFTLFRDNYKNFSPLLRKDFFVLVRGRVEIPRWKTGNDIRPEFFAKEIIMLSEIREKHIRRVKMKIPLTEITDDFINDFAKIIDKVKGNVNITIVVEDKDDNLFTELYPKREKIVYDNKFLKFIKNYDIDVSIN
ncbi:MAG TPA: DNA polymerase III subunit alpha, partial [Salinivirgaceae bacterium]|nr:DNA polymerase III subunit alpha [Salinivirgaceae bacterium]